MSEILIVDGADDVGGVWHWNSYPGAAVDIMSYTYFPYLDRTGFVPSCGFVKRKEILDYMNLLIDREKIRSCIHFRRWVTKIRFDEVTSKWDLFVLDGDKQLDPYREIPTVCV